MMTKVYYISPENQDYFFHVADQLMMNFPCWMESQPVEMDWLEVTVKCRQEDIIAIEKAIAPYI